MSWKVEYLPEAEKDLKALDGSQRNLVLKAIKKVQQNPLPVSEQGYGKPLGNHNSTSLAGLMKRYTSLPRRELLSTDYLIDRHRLF